MEVRVQLHIRLDFFHFLWHEETYRKNIENFGKAASHSVIDVAEELLLAELFHLRISVEVSCGALREQLDIFI
jgi:hypothetical protein